MIQFKKLTYEKYMINNLNAKLKITFLFGGLGLLLGSSEVSAEQFPAGTTYQTCFTPGEDCTHLITNLIDGAKESLFIQAYSFTSAPIAHAILEAKKRGVGVNIILDKSQVKNNQYSSSTFLQNNAITTYVDYKPAIAHNKIIIIDKKTLITGSFNFTKSAQFKNAENILVIHDKALSQKYIINWQNRLARSIPSNEYIQKKSSFKRTFKGIV